MSLMIVALGRPVKINPSTVCAKAILNISEFQDLIGTCVSYILVCGINVDLGHIWRRKWQSTPALLPGKSYGRRSLIGYSPWGRKESDMTEQLHFTSLGHIFESPLRRQASLSITNSWSSLRLTSIESVMPSSHLILCPFSSCPQSLPASGSFPVGQLFA